MSMQSRVLIVDDDAEMRESLGELFSAAGHGCNLAHDAIAALGLVDSQTFDAVICDVVMDGMGGLEFLDRVRFVDESQEVSHYAAAFDQASSRALDPQRSRVLFEELALLG